MTREMFLFKKSWRDAICGLAIQVRMSLYEAIIDYCLFGTESELKGQARATFRFIKQDIDSMNMDYNLRQLHISSVRSAAGRKGAAVTNGKTAIADLPKFAENQTSSHAHVIGDNNKNNNQDLEDKNKEKIERESQKRKNEKGASALPSPNGEGEASSESVNVRAFIEYFNETLCKAKAVIPHNCTYTEKRDAAIHARVREHGRKSLQVMVEKAAQSDFLNGKNSRTFVASLDWLLRPNNFVKVIEGNYDAIQNSKFNVQSSMFKVNSYGKTQQSDPRRGVAAQKHSAEEY